MTKSNFKKSVITSFQWRHRYYVTENVTRSFHFGPLPIKISVHASVYRYAFSKTASNERLLVKWR